MTDFAVLSDRAVVAIEGDEATSFLQGLLTQNVDAATANGAAFSALLTPQGKILFDFFLTPGDGGFLLDVAAEAADALVKRLTLYKLRAIVTIERRADLAVGWRPEGEPVGREVGDGFQDPRADGLGVRRIAAPDAFVGSGDGAYDAQRLALGAPEWGKDFEADAVFLLDVNYDALHGVDYKKGCFVGQEVTSRMKRKGEVRKRTYRVTFNGAAPSTGAAVTAGGTTLGDVSSVGEGIALARIRTDRLAAADAPAEIDGQPVELAAPNYL